MNQNEFECTWELLSQTIEDVSFCDEDIEDSVRNTWTKDILSDTTLHLTNHDVQNFLVCVNSCAIEYYFGYVGNNSPGPRSEHKKQYKSQIKDLKELFRSFYTK